MDTTAQPVTSHQNVRLERGAHRSPGDGACVMELVSMLAGERFSDRPGTACPVIGAFLRAYNDVVADTPRQDLLACAAAVVDTRRPEAEPARVEHCIALARELHRTEPRWRRHLDAGQRLRLLLEIGEGSVNRTDVDRLGYLLAHRLRRSRGGRARAVELVMELAAIGAEPEPVGTRRLALSGAVPDAPRRRT